MPLFINAERKTFYILHIDDVKFLFCFFKENYDSFISYHLGKSGFDISKCPELQQVWHSSDFFDKAYEVVRSPHMIKEHCKAKTLQNLYTTHLRVLQGTKKEPFPTFPSLKF